MSERRPQVVRSPRTGQAHGRPLPLATLARPRSPADRRDARTRLLEAYLLRELARGGVDIDLKPRALKARQDRARRELGPLDARRLTRTWAESTGPLLSVVCRAHVDARTFAGRAVVRLVLLLDEHAVEGTAASTLLASSAQWSALAELLRARAFEMDPRVLSQARTGSTTAQMGALGDLLKLASTCSNTARLDLLAALQIERASTDARAGQAGRTVDAERQARLREYRAEQAAMAAMAAMPDEPDAGQGAEGGEGEQ
jgi:hypothetical protein